MIYIYHFDTSDQRKPQGYKLHITLITGDIALCSGANLDIAV